MLMLQDLCQYSYLTFFAHNPLLRGRISCKTDSKASLANKKAGARAMRTPAQYRDDMSVTFYT